MKAMTKANLYLVMITAFWGLTFPLSHRAIQYISPQLFVFVRFLLAAVLMVPMLFYHRSNRKIVYAGIVLGLLNTGTFLCQTIGLQFINPARSAFITGMSVLFVPFLLPFFRLGYPKVIDVVCGLVCLLGLFILTGANIHHLNIGDLYTILGAVFVSFTISFVQWVTRYVKSYGLLNFYQVFFTVPLTSLGVFHQAGWHQLSQPTVMFAIIFCAVFATVIALYVQLKYQQHTTAMMVALIFVLEPVFGAIFSVLMGDVTLHVSLVVGGAIIVLSLLLPGIVRERLS